ncbi:MAG: N-acetyl-alpha-D-glucosaminyl L-malate synthase BshA [Deltaproteobacteria bacterium]|nr:N-acetyl-alpha-D-glucosaminyl L-malate synthase BshA [Deltaproteobacteria bacterium]
MDGARPLGIGIVCYPTFGGSGVIATEVGLALAARGHRVHLFAYARPARLHSDALVFHRVEVRDYPVFHHPPYAMALASRIVDVARHEPLDVLHVHYAVPHATSALLARDVLASDGARVPRIVTTLHGTDITLVGSDPIYRPITRFSILESDAVTVPSRYLRDETRARLALADQPIEIVPNFVDTERFASPARRTLGPNDEAVLVHVSNLRPVKRAPDCVDVLARVAAARPARLVFVGDGPDLGLIESRAAELGVADRVTLAGELDDVREHLARADVFLLPSALESFGVAALEAMAMGVPVIASDVGGLPEVVAHGETGMLAPVGDVESMARATLELLADPARCLAMGRAARDRAAALFRMGPVIDRYEAIYRRLVPVG